jgi:hypothetical protein
VVTTAATPRAPAPTATHRRPDDVGASELDMLGFWSRPTAPVERWSDRRHRGTG